jgi:hypothetical protein
LVADEDRTGTGGDESDSVIQGGRERTGMVGAHHPAKTSSYPLTRGR